MSEQLRSDVEIQSAINDAWLGLSPFIKDNQLYNPLANIPTEFEDEAHLYITWLMMQPEYFSFLCNNILNVKLLPFQALILKTLYNHKFPMFIGSRGLSKSFLLAVYCWIRALTLPGRKIVIAGSTFRQSKVVFEYMEKIWNNSPILRNICACKSTYGPKHDVDMWRFYIGDSVVNAIPIGPTGDNIRGLRAHDLIAEEFKSHNRDIFETVLVGFGAVSADPVENVQRLAALEMAKKLNFKLENIPEDNHFSNQLILSGTAYYQFNHFYDYWKRWKGVILSKGDKTKYETLFGEGTYSQNINYKDYCIIRIPIELAPDGFMDKDQIARSKATMHSGNYQCEYGCAWSTDSNGFFKRSLLENCTVSEKTDISFPSCKKVLFYPTLIGNKKLQYAIGVDPASEEDNFAIKVLELHPEHRRIVYGWTITKKEQKARLNEGTISQNDFYTFCARKIRELIKHFPTVILGIDSQGGGYALMEALLRIEEPGDLPIYEMIDYNDPKETDGFHGLHIIKKIQFADSKWMSEANNSLRLAFEQKTLLFPHNDALSSTFAEISDNSSNRLYDTLEDCVQDIEELKDELSTIIMTSTDSGRDKWTTPDRKEPGMKKGKMRKDRYTALLIANSVADFYLRSEIEPQQTFIGGFAHNTNKKDDMSGPEFMGPSWYVEQMRGVYD